jgi:DNA-directed RNA polymerase subunit N (RpoN/RPB10)
LRCERCSERLSVDWGEHLERVQERADAHECDEETGE